MQKSETKIFDENAYKRQYDKEHYKNIQLKTKLEDYSIIDKFCKEMNISKNQLLVKSALYVIQNDLLSEIKK